MIKRILLFVVLFLPLFSFAQNEKTIFLTGNNNSNAVKWDFFCSSGMNSGKWSKIKVPSCWELKGFGNYNYGHYEPDSVEHGIYKRTFFIDSEDEGKNIVVFFEGVMTDAKVKINGEQAGPIHRGAFYRFKYDITNLVNYGDSNVIEVMVHKRSSNKSVNEAERQADYWVFGGIFRPVYIKVFPEYYIEHLSINAEADGNFAADVSLNKAKKGFVVSAELVNEKGLRYGDYIRKEIQGEEGDSIRINANFEGVKTWNPEDPNLYKLRIYLENGNGIVHSLNQKFGFRTVEVKRHDGIYVNGKKIFMKGVNRHSFRPSTGRTLSKKNSIEDVMLIKEMNMNAVRMSHYPPDKHFLNVCDSLGLFVIDELTGWQASYDTKTGKKLVKEMIRRDVNHPSIILWANGNEGGWNTELDYDFHFYDIQKRNVIHPWDHFNGLSTHHYKTYNCCSNIQFGGDEVFFPTEFLHGLYDGGHGAGLEDFTERMYSNPLCAGGFLWVFADEGVVRTDMDDKIDAFRDKAPDGILGPNHEKEGSFYAIKEIWSPVVPEVKILNNDFDGKIRVKNRYLYTNLSECKFIANFSILAKPFCHTDHPVNFTETLIESPDIEPGETGFLDFTLPMDWKNYDIMYLSAYNKRGEETYKWSYKIKKANEIASETFIQYYDEFKIKKEDNKGEIVVNYENVEVSINRKNGKIESVYRNDTLIPLSGGPIFVGKDVSALGTELLEYEDSLVVNISYDSVVSSARWVFLKNGLLKFEYSMNLGYGDYDNIGVTFKYPEDDVESMRLMSYGPYRVYKNRMKGNVLKVHSKEFNNAITGKVWDYPEFKGFYKDFYWVNVFSKGACFSIINGSKDPLFLRMFTPEKPKHIWRDYVIPEFPEGDISFLNGISPIGTKFNTAASLGPQGKKNRSESHRMMPLPFEGKIFFDFTLPE